MECDILVIGGGAAGYFAAIAAKRQAPALQVYLAEQGKPLEKVRISGGGRCNVTHHLADPVAFSKHYPRGERFLRKAFSRWGQPQTADWFAAEGVRLVAEADGRMFPHTNTSQTIVDCLQAAARRAGVHYLPQTKVNRLSPAPTGWEVLAGSGQALAARRVIVCTGGSPGQKGLQWLADLGLPIVSPVPSLFSFNIPQSPLAGLEGLSAPARVRIAGTRTEATGPLLITHWGVSGPAVLRLSAWEARHLHARNYQYQVRICWLAAHKDDSLMQYLEQQRNLHPRKLVHNSPIDPLPRRLWERLCTLATIPPGTVWAELPAKPRNRLLELLLRQDLSASGRTTYKEEFVTAGGVDLACIDPQTMESPLAGLHLAGEVLDIDGITGGFNFQAAWTTGWIAGTSAATALWSNDPLAQAL
ncbi:MAG: aminoacetone oxidase family FAD-binding enzyme [Bacteroidetes bacterium]|nr:aminoacetone oxidase family FAD-binding enzyme [Bacteroidota bacterium]